MDDVDTILKILRHDGAKPNLLPELVINSAATMSRNIFTHWHRLNAIVERHESAIRGRWKKKSPAKRRELLGTVFPGIPDMHRPDMSELHSECSGSCVCEDADRSTTKTELWPYINSEDLSDAKSLLVFINARARKRPATFASSELSFSGLATPTHATRYPNVFVRLTGRDLKTLEISEEMYGRVEGFGDEEQSEQEPAQKRPGYPLGPALQILRIQEGILKFLVGCCEHIMHDVLPEMLCSDVYPLTSEPPSLSDQEDIERSLAATSRRAPYSARSLPNFARIRHLILIVLQNFEDHAWALREDPGYFADHIQEHADHRYENIPNEAGNPSERLGTKTFYSSVLREMLSKAYSNLILWDELYRLSTEVEALHEMCMQSEPGEELLESYFSTVEMLYYMLTVCNSDAATLIHLFSTGSPQLRHLSARYTVPGESDYSSKPIQTDDVVGICVRDLLTRATKCTAFVDYSHFSLDCLETYCMREPSARDKLSPFIEEILTTFSACVECLHQLRVSSCYTKLRPHFDGVRTSPVFPTWIKNIMRPLARWAMILDEDSGGVVAPDLGNPTDGKFDYPSEDIHTKEAVEARRKAERNLDKFWRYVDKSFRKRTGYSQHDTMRRLLDEGGPMRRTPRWHDPDNLGSMPISPIVYEYQPISEVFHDSTKEITGNFNRLAFADKVKKKTHGEMTATFQEVDQDAQEQSLAMSKPLYHVGKDAYVVIKALFHVPNDSEPPGKIRWDQFVGTLTKLGFAVEKLHGSAWQFTPKTLNLPRGIQFHEPHPSGEVPLTLARRYGRRLARAYGWEAAMFKQK
jgi:hypothetical protein